MKYDFSSVRFICVNHVSNTFFLFHFRRRLELFLAFYLFFLSLSFSLFFACANFVLICVSYFQYFFFILIYLYPSFYSFTILFVNYKTWIRLVYLRGIHIIFPRLFIILHFSPHDHEWTRGDREWIKEGKRTKKRIKKVRIPVKLLHG